MRNRIRELRKAHGLTMKKFGAILGLGESTISQYETGKRDPDFATLSQIADYFGVTLEYLLCIETDDNAPKYRIVELFKGAGGFLSKVFDPYPDDEIDELVEDFFSSLEDEGYSFSQAERSLIHAFAQLNGEGKQKAIERIEELAEIPKYRKTPQE